MQTPYVDLVEKVHRLTTLAFLIGQALHVAAKESSAQAAELRMLEGAASDLHIELLEVYEALKLRRCGQG